MTNQIDIYFTINNLTQKVPFGTYDIDINIYQQIKSKLGQPSDVYIKNKYYNRNVVIEEINNNYKIYQQNQYNFMISNKSIITMSSIQKLDMNSVPILSKYDNFEKIKISEYNKNEYRVLLEEYNDKYYVHIILNDENKIIRIIKDFEELTAIDCL